MALSTFSAPIGDRWFEDYVVGAAYEFGPTALTEADIVGFARLYDPQDMHVDAALAAKSAFGGLIASGWQTVGVLMRLAVDHYLSHVASIVSPGVDELRWLKPVRPGDALTLRVTTLESRPSASRPDRGLVLSRLEGVNQDGEIVCSMKAMNLMLRRPAA
ncbi:MAG: MaoC family dehydratase [Hyphomicrobiales bacterium]|nr:MaoC family dehydratase [Hyphomicrobiales bacterium]